MVEHWERWQDNPTAPIIRAADLSDEEQKEFIIKDNVGYGEWDYDMLANDWEAEDLEDWGLDVWQSDNNDGGDGAGESSKPANGSLADRFVIPPFSILDTRKGYWQARCELPFKLCIFDLLITIMCCLYSSLRPVVNCFQTLYL